MWGWIRSGFRAWAAAGGGRRYRRDIGDIGVLTKLAGEVGLDETEFEVALTSRKYREAHQRALRHAYGEAGGTGVPMFVIGDQTLTGLQDRATLEAVIEKERAASEGG